MLLIFLDYSKVFDSVPHCELVSKLEGYGIHGELLLWLFNFLADQLQRVVMSVLGLLLFTLYAIMMY